jgi:hypothetical protein
MDPMNPTNPSEEEVPTEEVVDLNEGEKYDGGEIPPAPDALPSNGEE